MKQDMETLTVIYQFSKTVLWQGIEPPALLLGVLVLALPANRGHLGQVNRAGSQVKSSIPSLLPGDHSNCVHFLTKFGKHYIFYKLTAKAMVFSHNIGKYPLKNFC